MKFLTLFLAMVVSAVAAAAQTANVTLAWEHDGINVTEYRLYEQTAPTTWTVVKTVTPPAVGQPVPKTVVLTGVTQGTHTYRLTAATAFVESGPSNTVVAQTGLGAPTKLEVKLITVITVTVP